LLELCWRSVRAIRTKAIDMGTVRGQRAFDNARLRKQQRSDPDGQFARALALQQAGRVAEAGAAYRQILQFHPAHFDSLHFLAVTEYQLRRSQDADRTFRKAIALNPTCAPLHSNHSLALHDLQRFEDAVASCDRAIAIKPDHAQAWCNRGNALRALERCEDALLSAERALAIRPNYHQAFDVRGSALFRLRRYEEAIASYDQAIALEPAYAEAWVNRGSVLTKLMQFDAALASFERAIELDGGATDAVIGRANVLLKLDRTAEAAAACQNVLTLNPNCPNALTMLGQCHFKLADAAQALACFDRALAIKPDLDCALSNRIFTLDFDPQAGFAEHQAARKDWWRHVGARIAAGGRPDHPNRRDPERRLVVGYVSSDFRSHSAAFAFGPVLRNHDAAQFELVCYHCAPFEDQITRQFQQAAHRWRDASRWSDARIAEQVRADGVDILVDLSGHSEGHRLGVFARKPAPIQVTAWGHITGTGLPTIDYLFGDPVLMPAEVRPLFAETIWDLPCAMAADLTPGALTPADPPMLARRHVTFGVFNRISKVSDEAIALWARILGALPASRLKLKHRALDDAAVRATLAERFASQGVAADRIDFQGTTSRDAHLKALHGVDICLDPFPQNGGVSTWEALQMGVPVVALLGNSAASRMSGSILASIGLGDWAGHSGEDYVGIALRFAAMPEHLRQLRHELPGRIAATPAGDPALFTRTVEQAYRAMWRDYCARATPAG
jgi:predicted O-linked N-acetylglucosamine transferase (SPINDLY family)